MLLSLSGILQGVTPLVVALRQQFEQLEGAAEQLNWLGRQRLLGVAGLLAERGLIPEQAASVGMLLAKTGRLVPEAQMREEARVLTAFVEAGLRVLPLKGCLLAYLVYELPDQRPRLDQDLLVAPEHLEEAREVLRALGYRLLWATAGGTPMEQEMWLYRADGKRWAVDLHWDLRDHPLLRKTFGFDEQWQASIALDRLAPGVRGQSPVHALLNAALHWFDDLYDSPRPLVWLLDQDLLWRQMSDEQQIECRNLARKRGVAGLLAECLRLTRAVFDTPVPDFVLADLVHAGHTQPATRLIDVAGPLQAWWLAVRCEPDLAARINRVRQSLLPSTAHMRERYPEGSKLGLPGMYWRRLRRRLG